MKIIELTLLSADLEKTASFYGDWLGFKINDQDNNSLSFSVGHSNLIFKKAALADQSPPNYHIAFNIPCNKVPQALEWLSSFTTILRSPENECVTDFKNWRAKAIYFYDLTGNILELIARSDLNNPSTKPFNTASIESISEIGLVVDHPLEFAEKLIDTHLPYFTKGPKREEFVVLGDDNGLLVISTPDRNWYPTDQPAQKCAVEVKLLMGNNTTKQISLYTE